MSEYERTATIQASPQAVFDFVADVENLPRYMPTTASAEPLGNEHVRVEGSAQGHNYSADGYFHADPNAQRLEWKADEGYYAGWLQVRSLDDGATSEVTVHIALQGYAPGTSPQQRPTDEQIERGLTDALAAIKASVEAS
jgi:uncharacterized protein YndB with AHSA1/START domain